LSHIAQKKSCCQRPAQRKVDMNDTPKHPRVIFLNQMAGPLFRELAEDISKEKTPSLLITGHPDTLRAPRIGSLRIVGAPAYRPESNTIRLISWLRYTFCALVQCWRQPSNALLFLVSNPPILGIVGYLSKRFRGQRYVFLIHDIYPDVLINFGVLKKSGLITRLWERMNRLIYENSEIVFAIGNKMAERLGRKFDCGKTLPGDVVVIPNWADTDRIRPIPKEKNDFAKEYGQMGKLTVMYSGKLGETHDVETILAAAKELKNDDFISFMIIGEGPKMKLAFEARNGLNNLTVLPFQPEDTLPFSLSTADIFIVTLDKGCAGLSVPSKTYYAMAAGAALMGLCEDESEVAHTIQQHKCGVVVAPGDIEGLVGGILALARDKSKLNGYRANSRSSAEKFYSRRNTSRYLEAIRTVGALQ
jgi:glycosyltransferase involved in cell wall biosynthesis